MTFAVMQSLHYKQVQYEAYCISLQGFMTYFTYFLRKDTSKVFNQLVNYDHAMIQIVVT